MSMTVDLKTLGLVLIGIAVLVLIIYLIILVRKAIQTLKKANVVLDDVQVVSGIASNRVSQLDGAVDDLAESITGVASAFRGNQETKKSIGILINALGALKNLLIKSKEADSKQKK